MAGQDSDGGGRHRENVYAASRDCVVILVLGDLVTRRHFVRGLEGAAQRFIVLMIRVVDTLTRN